MTVERRLVVAVPTEMVAEVSVLQAAANRALARAMKAPPGDRVDVVRFEVLSTQLESLGIRLLNAGQVHREVSVGSNDDAAVVVHGLDGSADAVGIRLALPLVDGAAAESATPRIRAAEPCEPWKPSDGVRGREAVKERFEKRVGAIAMGASTSPITPSGVANRVLTEVLRKYALEHAERGRVVAPVRYRDGSAARAFPLGYITRSTATEQHTYRFTLLSMRHVEMDRDVDGAWLRNTEISRPRPMADTDKLAYLTSVRQLKQLLMAGPAHVLMYQTGLEPAIIGFYRAVAETLAERSGMLRVTPHYFRKNAPFDVGTPWMA